MRELAEMEECIGYLHAEADKRRAELARAEAAGQELTAALGDCRGKLAAAEAAHAEQVPASSDRLIIGQASPHGQDIFSMGVSAHAHLSGEPSL
jgi:hypothetical protein